MSMRKPSRGRSRPARPCPEPLEGRALLAAVAFDAEALATAGAAPRSVTSGDLNGDGIADLIESHQGFVAVRTGRGDGTFFAPTIIDQAGFTPASTVLGDFDGDGKVDLVVLQDQYKADYTEYVRGSSGPSTFPGGYIPIFHPGYPSTIQVFLNRGDGTFAAQAAVQVSPQPKAIAAGDVDGDGKLDLVVGRSVLLGRGDGTFASPTPIVADNVRTINSLVLADLDGDGRLDVVESLAPYQYQSSYYNVNGQVDVRPGRGDGTFGDPIPVALDTTGPPGYVYDNPGALAVADFDGDGKPDLAVLDRGLHTLAGRGDGSFGTDRAYDVGLNPVAVVAGDFDRDGKLDLAVTVGGSSEVAVVRGEGDGTFAAARSFGLPGLLSPVLADFDGDGHPDLALLAQVDAVPNLVVRRGLGDGSFGPATYQPLPGLGTSWLAAGDLNGDGKPHLVVVDAGLPGVTYAGDVATYSLQGQGLLVLLGRGDGTFDPPAAAIADPLRSPYSVTIADVDGDGKPDLVESFIRRDGAAGLGVDIRLGRGDGTFAPAVDLDPEVGTPSTVAVADLDGDGRMDLAVTEDAPYSSGTGHVGIWLNRGSVGTVAFAPETMFATGINPGPLAIADLNGDGKPDLVVVNRGDSGGGGHVDGGNVVILLGAGGGSFLAATEVDAIPDAMPTSASVVDLDGDGLPDLVIAINRSSTGVGIVDVLLNQGSAPGTFTLAARPGVGSAYSGAIVADLNGDGKADVLAVGPEATALLGQGGGAFLVASRFPVAANPVGLAVADFDGDGRPDLATLGTTDGAGTVLINATTPTLFPFSTRGAVAFGTEGSPIPGTTLATIVDADPLGHAGDFRATVDWGDGSPAESASIVATGPGTLAVVGGHTYGRAGLYAASVVVRNILGGGPGATTTLVGVAPAPIIPVHPVIPVDPVTPIIPVQPGGPALALPLLVGVLDPASDRGISSTDRLTNDNTPTFQGFAEPGSTIRLYVRAITQAGQPGFLTLVGRATAGADGSWGVTSVMLADGPYAASVATTTTDGRIASLDLAAPDHPLTIDTAGPRILAVRVDPRHGRIFITYADPFAGLDSWGGLDDPAAYRFRRGIDRALQGFRVTGATSTAGSSPTDPRTVTLTIKKGRRIGPGLRYLLRVDSGRVADRAGNALDGEYAGSFATGDGHPGGNFAAVLTIRGGRATARPSIPRGMPPPGRPRSTLPGPARRSLADSGPGAIEVSGPPGDSGRAGRDGRRPVRASAETRRTPGRMIC